MKVSKRGRKFERVALDAHYTRVQRARDTIIPPRTREEVVGSNRAQRLDIIDRRNPTKEQRAQFLADLQTRGLPRTNQIRGSGNQVTGYTAVLRQTDPGSCEYITPPDNSCTATSSYIANVYNDEGVLTYLWEVISGIGIVLSDPLLVDVTAQTTEASDKEFTLRCTVTDTISGILAPTIDATHRHTAIPKINVDDIIEDSAGTCDYPPAGTCIARSVFTVDTSGGKGTPVYLWDTTAGIILSGQGTASIVVEIDAGVDVTNFNISCDVSDDTGSDVLIASFEQIRVGLTVAPTVDAGGPYSGDAGTPVQLTGTVTPGSDASPAILWTEPSGLGGVFSNASIVNPTFTADISSGGYLLQLSADPSDGAAVTDTATLSTLGSLIRGLENGVDHRVLENGTDDRILE